MDSAQIFLLNPYSASVITLSAFLWIFKKTYVKYLDQEVGKEVEKYKSELSKEREIIKHDLNKEALKAQYLSSGIQEIYPELYKKLLLAEGPISGLVGLRYLPDWKEWDEKQVDTFLREKEIAEIERKRIVELFRTGAQNRATEIQSVLDLISLRKIESDIREAKNYYLLKSLFISDEVKDDINNVFNELWSAWADLETWFCYGKDTSGIKLMDIKTTIKKIPLLIEELERSMRKELFPNK